MRYIDSSSIGAISSVGRGGRSVPSGAGVFSLTFGALGARKLSKAQRKKIAGRRRRRFVDNIIMHHKRLHDRNRQITIDLVRKKNEQKEQDRKKRKEQDITKERNKWRDKYAKNGRALEIKERINARRIKAKSNWTAMIEDKRRKMLEGNIEDG